MESEISHSRMTNPVNIRLDEDVLKTSYVFGRRLDQDVFIKTNILTLVICLQKMYSRRLDQDKYIRLGNLSSRHQRSSRRFQNVLPRCCKNVFKTSSRQIGKMSWRKLKTFSTRIIKLNCCCEHVFKMTSRRIQHVFETFWEDDYLQKYLPRSHLWEIYDQGTKNPLDIPKLLKQFFKTLYEVTSVIVKACVHYFLSKFYFSPNDTTSKTMENVFYFI